MANVLLNKCKDDDLKANLRNYEIQLQQVEAALGALNDEPSTDEERDSVRELQKLKTDLETVMQLTQQLIDDEERDSKTGANADDDERKKLSELKSGDLVLAPWSENGLYYKATVEDITSDGQCNVYFLKNDDEGFKGGINEVCLVSFLKPIQSSNQNKRKNIGNLTGGKSCDAKGASDDERNKKSKQMKIKRYEQKAQIKEGLKKKQQKKINRIKELEEERERDKNKWQSFYQKTRTIAKRYGVSGSGCGSIFASPSTIEGKVGVGTCGIGGKPMTDYVVQEKYKRATKLHKPT
ncbi:survival of motor neuron-related-splicing factor 30-like protein [Dinothrombium tinctorium]|uniref:Survival of motor neuron-related-splicing factor 30-like protein n=1 Tax=Dinothrombium tinctorium TaxID=1965070 RepID=A0A3S3P7H7_9ACAR|nr:survival of motor neuron-related-splicing factor 30-like protein [Dinothrombium tinctorium]RWS14249.1 survival of motor neuron-related-splicing factor 30-like protein [Dinothrombium tinctorium]RWS16574.1 survival of motor neuron-related-splicing factor 30-like protein [Dinothrombium tinctorium]RWS16590.1 survival of motor neuron-related-splicing factor 30-like protein [Dinothrombium tinctorium]